MKISPDVAVNEVPEGAVILNTRTGKYYHINTTGLHVLRTVGNGQSISQVAAHLASATGADIGLVQRDVSTMVKQFLQAKVLQQGER